MTFALTAINIAYFVFCESRGDTTTSADLFRFGAVESIHVWAGEPWRIGSYMFLHIGWFHLLWNSWASFSISTSVEGFFGSRRFLFLYLASGIGGGCAVALVSAPGSPTAGASGAMFGIIGAILAVRHHQLGSFAAFTTDKGIQGMLFNIVVWTVIGFSLHVSWQAHFGGLVVGSLAAMMILRRRTTYAAAFGVGMIALFFFAYRPWWRPRGEAADRALMFAEGYLEHDPHLPDNVARGERIAHKACTAGIAEACPLVP